MLDRHLCDVEQLLTGEAPRGEMFEAINDLTENQREQVLRLVRKAHAQIRLLRDQFNLEIKREYVHQWLGTHEDFKRRPYGPPRSLSLAFEELQ